MSIAGHALGDTADQKALDGAFPVRAHDDEIRPLFLCLLQDGAGRTFPADAQRYRQALPPQGREMRDLWHNAWSFLAILALLSIEWTLRRRWGLR